MIVKSGKRPYIPKKIERISSDSKAIEDYVQAQAKEANKLRSELEIATKELNKLQVQLADEEKKAKAVQELLNKNYNAVIKEVFQEPTNRILLSMITQSRRGLFTTLIVAVLSIIVSFGFSANFSMQSSRDIREIQKAMGEEEGSNLLLTNSKERRRGQICC